MGNGQAFAMEECEPKTHQLLPIQNGAVCTRCGKRFYWEAHLSGGKLKEPKPWQSKQHLMQ